MGHPGDLSPVVRHDVLGVGEMVSEGFHFLDPSLGDAPGIHSHPFEKARVSNQDLGLVGELQAIEQVTGSIATPTFLEQGERFSRRLGESASRQEPSG